MIEYSVCTIIVNFLNNQVILTVTFIYEIMALLLMQ